MQDANEFVFRRRRKRLRTLDAEEVEGVVPLDQANDAQFHLGLVPEIAVLPELVTSSPALPEPSSQKASSGNTVTVDKSLCRFARTVPKTKQADPGTVSRSRAYTHHRPPGREAMFAYKVAKSSGRSQRSSRLAKTLFRAAVLADGDPLDTLADDVRVCRTRRPLKFVPFNKFASPSGLDQASSDEPSDPGCRKDPARHTRHYTNISDPKGPKHLLHTSSTRVPLCLVPLREAEAAYSIMFP